MCNKRMITNVKSTGSTLYARTVTKNLRIDTYVLFRSLYPINSLIFSVLTCLFYLKKLKCQQSKHLKSSSLS